MLTGPDAWACSFYRHIADDSGANSVRGARLVKLFIKPRPEIAGNAVG